jgi:hypothetical protein
MLRRGTYGEVYFCWNVTTSEEFVAKRPIELPEDEEEYDEQEWINEASIMDDCRHVRIT